jgi:hypothetical protein
MKYFIKLALAASMCFVSIAYAHLPDSGHFDLQLTKVIEGDCSLFTAPIQIGFKYNYQFSRNHGDANGEYLNNNLLNLTLHPSAVDSKPVYGFLTDTAGKKITLGGKEVLVTREVLLINTDQNSAMAAVIIQNSDGSTCTLATENYQE